MKMICLFHSSTFEVCDHNVVMFIRAAVPPLIKAWTPCSKLQLLTVSRHCAHGACPERVIIIKRRRNSIRVCRRLNHEITKKRRFKAANCACMYECITFQNVSQMHTKIHLVQWFAKKRHGINAWYHYLITLESKLGIEIDKIQTIPNPTLACKFASRDTVWPTADRLITACHITTIASVYCFTSTVLTRI